MSLQSTYLSVKGLIANNLESMGVDASSSDGLTTLAGKILDIEPSIGGLDLDTAVTLSVSSSTVVLGESITCTAILTAEYDDETLVDVDLHGVLQNATIKLYEGSTLMTSAITNANGVATLTYTPTSSGTKTIKAVFEGTENFNDCESTAQSITVTQPVPASVSLSSDKSILSYADSDSCVLTATVLDSNNNPCVGETVSFDIIGGSNIDSATTGADGTCSVYYYSEGTGDLSIRASVRSLVSEIYGITDYIDYDPATSDKSSKYASPIALRGGAGNISYDSTNHYYIIKITSAGELFAPISSATGLDDIIIEFDGYLPYAGSGGYNSLIGLTLYSDTNNWVRLGTKVSAIEYGNKISGSYSETDITGTSALQNTWLHHKFTITNDTIHKQIYNGNTLLYDDTKSYSSSWFTSSTKYGIPILYGTLWKTYFKNLKIKPL